MAHMPALDNPENYSIAALVARVAALELGVGSGNGIGRINVTSAPYNAVGDDGDTDNTAGIQAALDAIAPGGASEGYELFFPPGRYHCAGRITGVGSNVRVVGRDATITFDSTQTNHLVSLASGASNVHFEGLHFEGNTEEDDKEINQYAAIYAPGGNYDVTLWTCKFTSCRPNLVAQGLTPSGRWKIVAADIFEAPLPASLPSDSAMVLCHLVNDEVVSTRSHGVYIFGYAENVRIIGNHFKNIFNTAVKFDSASARYGQKKCGIVTENHFEGGGGACIWIGSDSGDDVVGNFVVGDNQFRNTNQCLFVYNGNHVTGGNNVGVWDWEATGAAGSVTAGVYVSSAVGVGQLSPGGATQISGWTLQHQHPFAGSIVFSGIPSVGNQITVGTTTYTWVAGAPATATEIQLQGSAAGCAAYLRGVLRGATALAPMNPVLRGPYDVLETNDGGPSGTVVIASDATFALSTTGTGATVVAVADKKVCFSAVDIRQSAHVTVTNCTFDSFNCVFAGQCYKPVIVGNTLIDTNVETEGSYQGEYDNRYETHRPHSASLAGHSPYQRARISDAWPKIGRNPGLTYRLNQEYTCPEMLGGSGLVPVSNGKAYIDLWYGTGVEATTTSVNAQHYKWTDGDTVRLTTPAAVAYTFTYKHVAPGANQFNSIATLRALIDGAGGGGVFVTSFVPTAQPSGLSLDLWIRITYDTVAANGNDCTLRVTTKSWITGRVLIDPDASAPDNTDAKFRGGNASANSTSTFIWTPLADPGIIPVVQGFDATSRALSPYVLQADIVPGIGFLARHGAAGGAGAEKLNWWIP